MSAFNAIYGRIGNKNSVDTITSLLGSVCAPILLYFTELINDDTHAVKKLCKSYDRTFMKIFCSFDINIIRVCQYYCNILPMSYQIDLKWLLFLRQVKFHPDSQLFMLMSCFSRSHVF